MITQFKLFEKISTYTDKFLFDYENEYKEKYRNKSIEVFSFKDLPKSCYDEFSMLLFMYRYPYVWKTNDKKINKKIQTDVKKYALDSVIKKIEETPELYYEIKEFNDKNPISNFYRLFYVHSLYLFLNAEKYTPSWIKDSNKFNI
jgi:hypothetical protein